MVLRPFTDETGERMGQQARNDWSHIIIAKRNTRFLLRRDQVVRYGEQGKLKARGDTGLIEDIGEMALDCFFTERELLGNVAVAAALNNTTHNFKLARGEAVGFTLGHGGLLHELVESSDEVNDALATDPIIAGVNSSDGGLQMVREGVFEDDATGADMQGLDDLLRSNSGSKKQDFGCGRTAHDGTHGFEAGHTRHGDIKKKNIRLELEGLSDSFVAVGGIAHDIESIVFREHVAHADADYRVVIREHDSDWSFHLC